VRQLLNHSSGIFDVENDDHNFRKAVDENPSKALSPREIVETSMKHAPYNKPGEGGHYSNANYKALGLIIEKVTGKDLGTVFRKKIFDKLGLKNTVFATKPEIKGKHIHGYALLPDQTIDTTVRPDIWELWASGNIVSTLADQKKWAEALGRGTLLSKKSYEEMTDWIEIEASLPGKFKYGLGVDLVGEGFIGHAGAVDGYYGRIAHDPETDTTIAVFFNNLSAREDVLVYENFLHELIDILQPPAPEEQVTPVLGSFVAPPRPAALSDGRVYLYSTSSCLPMQRASLSRLKIWRLLMQKEGKAGLRFLTGNTLRAIPGFPEPSALARCSVRGSPDLSRSIFLSRRSTKCRRASVTF